MGSQLWQYNTHGVQEQLKFLQGLGSLLRHQISAIHNKGHCSLPKNLVMRSAVLIPICDLFNHNEWLPWLQTNWRGGGSWWFTLGLETNHIKQLEGKLVQITGITTIILQILTTKHLWGRHLLPIRAWKFPWWHSCIYNDLVDVPRIVSEEIWTSCQGGVLCN